MKQFRYLIAVVITAFLLSASFTPAQAASADCRGLQNGCNYNWPKKKYTPIKSKATLSYGSTIKREYKLAKPSLMHVEKYVGKKWVFVEQINSRGYKVSINTKIDEHGKTVKYRVKSLASSIHVETVFEEITVKIPPATATESPFKSSIVRKGSVDYRLVPTLVNTKVQLWEKSGNKWKKVATAQAKNKIAKVNIPTNKRGKKTYELRTVKKGKATAVKLGQFTVNVT